MSTEKYETKGEKSSDDNTILIPSSLVIHEPSSSFQGNVEVLPASTSRSYDKSCKSISSTSKSPDTLQEQQIDSNRFNSIKKHLFSWKNKKRKTRSCKSSLNVWDENYNDDELINFTEQNLWRTKNGPSNLRNRRSNDSTNIDVDVDLDQVNDIQEDSDIDSGDSQVQQRLLSDNSKKLVEIVKHKNNFNCDCDISVPSSSITWENSNAAENTYDNNVHSSTKSVAVLNGCSQKQNKNNLVEKCKKEIFYRDKRRTSLTSFKFDSAKKSRSNQTLANKENARWHSNLKCSRSYQNINFYRLNNNFNLKRNISVGDEMYTKDTLVCFNDKCVSGYIRTKVYKRHSCDSLLNQNLFSLLCNSGKPVANTNRRKSKVDIFLKSLVALTTGKKLSSSEIDNINKDDIDGIYSSQGRSSKNDRPLLSSPNSLSLSYSELHNSTANRSSGIKYLYKSCSDINSIIAPAPNYTKDSFSNLKFIDSDHSSSCNLNPSSNSNLDNGFSSNGSLAGASSKIKSSKSSLNSLQKGNECSTEYLELEKISFPNDCVKVSKQEGVCGNSESNSSRKSCIVANTHYQTADAKVKCCDSNGQCTSKLSSSTLNDIDFISSCEKPSRNALKILKSEKSKAQKLRRPKSVILADECTTLKPSMSNSHSSLKSMQNLSESQNDISSNLVSLSSQHSIVPVEPVNRFRIPSIVISGTKTCSTCSSLLSLASSSIYSISSSAAFIPIKNKNIVTVLCKVCLNEVELKDSWALQQCNCTYCVSCVQAYVEFEINQGAYHISCPDAQCASQGIIQMEEIESLVNFDEVEKHKRFKLNKEVELDKSRVWCPKPGCETVCTLNGTVERTVPQSVHCPTCFHDFCSNCRAAWHSGTPCRQEDLQPSIPGVSFDSELIKCCPMCSVPIEKDEGCAQMMCKRCKHVFCWYCLASLDDDFLLRHYDKGPCKNKLGHSRASVIWHRTQVIGIFAGFGILLLIASPLLLLAAPCIICCKCRVCTSGSKLDGDDLPEDDLT